MPFMPISNLIGNDGNGTTRGQLRAEAEAGARRPNFAAAALLSGAPITVVILLTQCWLISRLAVGGVKG